MFQGPRTAAERQCYTRKKGGVWLRKRGWSSKKATKRAINRIAKKHPDFNKGIVDIYQCNNCGQYHYGRCREAAAS
jgi:DICT domain-containing protein